MSEAVDKTNLANLRCDESHSSHDGAFVSKVASPVAIPARYISLTWGQCSCVNGDSSMMQCSHICLPEVGSVGKIDLSIFRELSGLLVDVF